MTKDSKRWVGTSVKRKEDAALLTGEATFVDDINLPGMLYCSILRSTYAHARIKKVDASEAKKLPGVAAVITGEDMKEYPLAPQMELSHFQLKSPGGHAFPIAWDKVRYVGEPVAAVAAIDRYIAEDALELIQVDYEPLTPVVNAEKALEKDSPLLYEEWGDNVQLPVSTKAGDVDKAFEEADHVIKARISEHRYSGFPLEARAILASYKVAERTLDVWTSTQAVCQARAYIARTLKLSEHNIRVIAPYVGGGFGNKLNWPVEPIPCILSMKTGRPVKFTEDRMENLISSPHSRDYVYDAELACKKDGKILGLKVNLIFDVGVEASHRGSSVAMCLIAAKMFLGCYKVENYTFKSKAVVTNKSFGCAYRAFAKDTGSRLMERMIDAMSRELGIPAEEIRKRNFIQPHEFPYRTATDQMYDSGNYPELLDRAMKKADITNLRKEQAKRKKEGKKLIGIGIASFVQAAGAAVPESFVNGLEGATVKLLPEGGLTLSTAHPSLGQGIQTTLAQVVADEFGVTPDDVRVIFGDTDRAPYNMGGFSSRGAVWVVGATVTAARKLKEKVLRVGANILGAGPEEVDLRGGEVFVKGVPAKSLSLAEIGRQATFFPGAIGTVPEDLLYTDPSLDATGYWTAPNPPVSWAPPVCLYCTHPSGSEVAAVEIDTETGKLKVLKYVAIYDCGTLINPDIVKEQFIGGNLQGVNGILNEEVCYDENGQPLTTTYMDYLIPTAHEIPELFEFEHMETPSPFTVLGAKGMGEAGTICSPSTIANAVGDALGVTVTKTPLKPETVLGMVKEAKNKGLI